MPVSELEKKPDIRIKRHNTPNNMDKGIVSKDDHLCFNGNTIVNAVDKGSSQMYADVAQTRSSSTSRTNLDPK